MNYVHPQLITAHAQLIGAPHHDQNADLKRLALLRSMAGTPQDTSTSRANVPVQVSTPSKPRVTHFSSGSSTGASSAADGDYKVTGTSIFDRPDDDSQWDPGNGGRWIRKWLPGEKEAEAQKRIGMAQNEILEDRQLTEQGRKERAALVGDITKAIKDGKFSQDEIPGLMREFGIAEDQIRMADALREREPTAREQFMKNTFTDERGIIFSPDGKVLYNPNDAIIKQQEFAMKREDALRARADKYEAELRKPYKAMVLNDPDDPTSGYTQGVEMRSEDDILKIMQKRFPSLYPSDDNGGNGGGTGDPAITPITPTFDETRFPNSTKAAQAAAERNAVPEPATQDAPAQARRQDDAYSAYADYEKK